ncbi:MAG: hypothetical protein ACMG6H_14970 [Acidobacteriota bacterium]
MKRIISLIFAIAAFAGISAPLSAPLSAQGNGGKYDRNNGVNNGDGIIDNRDRSGTSGCSWWEINCSNANSSRGGGWYQVGRDRHGDLIYERRVIDRKGNTVIQTARRERNGRLHVINTRRVKSQRNAGRYDTRADRRDDNDYDRAGDRHRGR